MNSRYTFALTMLAITAIACVAVLGFDVNPLAQSAGHDSLIKVAEFGAMLGADTPKELKAVFDRIGEAFKSFKDAHEEEIKGIKKGMADVVTSDKLIKINEALDKSVEAKATLDAALAAEKKHVDEIERKLNKLGLANDDAGKSVLELKTFNGTLKSISLERGRPVVELDAKGYDEYKAAQVKYMREGKDSLSSDEVKTLAIGSDPDGGYFVTPDTSGRIVKKVYETSPVRQYADVRTISVDALEGIEDLGEAGAGYAGERSQGTDITTPQVSKWKIPVFNLDTEPKATQNLLDDSTFDVEGWLGDKVGSKLGRFENNEFVNGADNKIRGFLGYAPLADSGSGVAWGSIGYMPTGVDADFAASAKGDKLYDLMGLLKNEYLINAAWFARRSTITAIRKFKDGQNNYLWQPSFVAGQPETIMGFPLVRMEDMPAIASQSFSLAFGDIKQAYQVVDRQGIRVLRDPFTSKPYIKFYTTKRTGGGVVNFEALKLMKFYTS
jgi:HK97 family phage major capsid protein